MYKILFCDIEKEYNKIYQDKVSELKTNDRLDRQKIIIRNRDRIADKIYDKRRRIEELLFILESRPDVQDDLSAIALLEGKLKHIKRKGLSDKKYEAIKKCLELGVPVPEELMFNVSTK